jgi:sugar phosphate isomerase/epimerase
MQWSCAARSSTLPETSMFRNLSTDALGFWAPQNEQIELALSFGFKSIDVDIVDYAEQVESRGVEKARRLIDSAKIKLGAFRLPVDLDADEPTYRQQFDKLAGYARLAAELGCHRSIAMVAPASDRRPLHENFELHRTRLLEVARVFEAQKIQLGLDFDALPHHREGKEFAFVSAFDALSKLVETVARSNLGLVIDTWQLHVSGSGLEAVRKLPAERVVYVKIADAPTSAPRDQLKEEHRLLSKTPGAIDLVGYVKALTAMNYAGPITPFPHFGQFHGRRRDQAIRIIAEAMDEIWRGAGLPAALRQPKLAIAPPPEPKEEPPSEEAQAEEVEQPA